MPTCEGGFSLIELLIVVAIILIIAAIAVPNLMKSKATANEASAVDSLHTINTACANYSTTYQLGYPATMADLGPASVPSSTAADLLDSVLDGGTKSGYTFSYSSGPPDPNGVVSAYTVTANPVIPGTSGNRHFYTDQSFVIRWNGSVTASSTDPPLN
jgi:prepilin-type N-terminal cleavage/methylation domain-containing protein